MQILYNRIGGDKRDFQGDTERASECTTVLYVPVSVPLRYHYDKIYHYDETSVVRVSFQEGLLKSCSRATKPTCPSSASDFIRLTVRKESLEAEKEAESLNLPLETVLQLCLCFEEEEEEEENLIKNQRSFGWASELVGQVGLLAWKKEKKRVGGNRQGFPIVDTRLSHVVFHSSAHSWYEEVKKGGAVLQTAANRLTEAGLQSKQTK